MDKKVLWVSDMPAGGSGFATISKPICNGLAELGFDVKVVALSNKGEEHWNKFSVIPVENMQEAFAAVHNLIILWKPDVVVVAVDIPYQEKLFARVRESGIKYIAITPLENGPLTQSWAEYLMLMDDIFFISELGKEEAIKAGVEKAKHLKVSLDTKFWYPPVNGERALVRKNLGFSENDKVILTVADNQERKNLWAALEIVSKLKKNNPDVVYKYVLVTREKSPYGHKLRELAYGMGLVREFIIFERGMPEKELRLLYISSDVFLLTSKAEGLGLPVIEALMCGCKCVTTDTGALHKLLEHTGWLVPPVYTFVDVWGNSTRDLIDTTIGAEFVSYAINSKDNPSSLYVAEPQSVMIEQLVNSIREVCGE